MAKKLDFKEGDILVVEWLDAHSVDEWKHPEELDAALEPVVATTVGFYLKTNHHHLVVTATKGASGDTAGVWAIPKGMVKKVEVIRGS